MRPFTLPHPLERILVIGCHADDIEIGCGATLLALTRAVPGLEVTWVVLGASGERGKEARSSANEYLAAADTAQVVVHDFRDGFMPYRGEEVKEAFEAMKPAQPDLVFTHARADLHQDHRLACELTWNTFRSHLILEYEIPKVDGDLGSPNVFVPVDTAVAHEKVDRLLASFPSQFDKHWFDREVFLGLMRLRGMECSAPSGYAEAFICRKATVQIS